MGGGSETGSPLKHASGAPSEGSRLPGWLIAGLGNPGEKYRGTRHNAGFLALDELIDRYHIAPPEDARKFKGLLGRGEIEGVPVFLLKPTNYVIPGGEALRSVAD